MFLENRVENSLSFDMELYASMSADAQVGSTQVRLRSSEKNQDLILNENSVLRMTIPVGIRMTEGSSIANKGVYVSADADITMYGINKDEYSNDGFLALPVDALGQEYYTVSYAPPTYNTELGVAAVEDGTVVQVHFPNSNPAINVRYGNTNYRNKDTLVVTLNRFQVLQVQSLDKADLTGTRITASAKVAVFSGNVRTNAGDGRSRDHLVEQMPPVKTWGKTFATVPIPRRTTGDIFRIVASQPNTRFSVRTQSGINDYTINNPGEFKELTISSSQYAFISSDKAILVVQLVYSQISSNEPADPAMSIVPPIDQYIYNYHFGTATAAVGSYTNYLMMVVPNGEQDGLRLNGASIIGVNWNAVPGTNLVGGYKVLTQSENLITHVKPNVRFMAIVYAGGDKESYAFPLGIQLKDLTLVSHKRQVQLKPNFSCL